MPRADQGDGPGASNQWFGLVESALYIPSAIGELEAAVDGVGGTSATPPTRASCATRSRTIPTCANCAKHTPSRTSGPRWSDTGRQEDEALPAEPVDLLAREYEVLVDPLRAR